MLLLYCLHITTWQIGGTAPAEHSFSNVEYKTFSAIKDAWRCHQVGFVTCHTIYFVGVKHLGS